MLDILLVKAASAVAIALVYMLFDVFNNRNVPDLFAYGTIVFAALLALVAATPLQIATSYLVGIAIAGFGFVVYRMGEIGAADIIEFAALAMLIPTQPVPALVSVSQLGLPFILSLVMDTGIAAVVMVPLYYIPKALSMMGHRAFAQVSKADMLRATTVIVAYGAFYIFATYAFHISAYGGFLFLALLVFSSLMLLFQKPITMSMVKMTDYTGFTVDDIIAFNMMSKGQISAAKRKIRSFDRLVTTRMIAEMKKKRVRAKFPLYKNAVPLAVPIFIGLVVALLFGNLVLLMFG